MSAPAPFLLIAGVLGALLFRAGRLGMPRQASTEPADGQGVPEAHNPAPTPPPRPKPHHKRGK